MAEGIFLRRPGLVAVYQIFFLYRYVVSHLCDNCNFHYYLRYACIKCNQGPPTHKELLEPINKTQRAQAKGLFGFIRQICILLQACETREP